MEGNLHCYQHPDQEATATCTSCGRAICQDCAVEVGSKTVCRDCLAKKPISKNQFANVPPLAWVSLVLGILGLIGCVCGGAIGGILLGLPSAICGWLARKNLAEEDITSGESTTIATIGLVLGAIEAVGGLLLLIIAGASFGGLMLLEGLS